VCTDPAHRGRALGRRVLAAVVGSIHAEGHRAFLHVLAANPAVDLYRTAGFVVRREITITVAQAPLRP
jgi:ribosomal protein S18 acetylase RimI-like enzyme